MQDPSLHVYMNHNIIILCHFTLKLNVNTASNFETCMGLEQLAMNTNPSLLSDCVRDDICTQVTCQATGIISGQLDSITIILEPCETPPGVTVELLKDRTAIINQLITAPTSVTHDLGFAGATVEAYVFVNSTPTTIGISVCMCSVYVCMTCI